MSELIRKLSVQRNEQEHIWGHLQADRWQATQHHAGNSVLDVGCANGIYVKELLKKKHRAIGIDLLAYDEWSDLQGNVFFGNALNLPFADKSFDTIISFETLEHIPNPQYALAEYHRVCKKNIIISVPNCDVPMDLRKSGSTFHHYIDQTHVNFFTLTTLKSLVENNDFRVKELNLFNPILSAAPFLTSMGIPIRYASKLAQGLNIFTKKYYMSLLMIAEKI